MRKTQLADLDVIRYNGTAKPKMFDSDALYQVDSLQVLCQKVLTVSKANDRDLRFLQGIIKEESCTNKECRCS